MLKVELHAHTDLDPADVIPYSTEALLDHAARLDYQAVAITPHDGYFDPAPWQPYATARGITLIAGIERTIHRKHVLLLNFSEASARVETFEDIGRLKAEEPQGLVLAPHAMFPNVTALRRQLLDRHVDLIDAVEVNGLFTRHIDFNAAGIIWAQRHGKPLVGSSDVHTLAQLGSTYSLVDAAPDPTAICEAIRAGRVEVRARPLSLVRAGWTFARMVTTGLRGSVRRSLGSGRTDAARV